MARVGAVARFLAAALAAAAVLGMVGPATAEDGAAREPSRKQAMTEALDSTGVYLDDAAAAGNGEVWRRRLQRGVRRSTVPVQVALWAEVEGVWPTQRPHGGRAADRVDSAMDPSTVHLVLEPGGVAVRIPDGVDGEGAVRAVALADQADAVVRRLLDEVDDPERHVDALPVTWAWVWLRLAGQERPDARALADELAGDVTLMHDSALPADRWTRPGGFLTMPLVVSAMSVVVVAIAVFLAWWRLTSRRAEAGSRSALVASLTDRGVEEAVTALSVAIAERRVRPGDASYDRAQACLDAAAQWVDVETDRARVGCHLLVEDGMTALAGRTVRGRCYFHPGHVAGASLQRGGLTVPCCRECRDAVRQGQRPDVLMVADADGVVAPYLEVDDVWSRTGYGALDHNFAKRALLAALEGEREGVR